MHGLEKGFFFSLTADRVTVTIDNKPALHIDAVSCVFTPRHIASGQLAFTIKGAIGQGSVDGILKIPVEGTITINEAELDAIPFLSRISPDIKGHLSSDIHVKNEIVNALFSVPDFNITSSPLNAVPLLNTYRRIRGSLLIKDSNIQFDSVSLEGEKGYARLKGNISNGQMNLNLELMPLTGTLNAGESLLLGRYIVSPGYYVIPIKGPLSR